MANDQDTNSADGSPGPAVQEDGKKDKPEESPSKPAVFKYDDVMVGLKRVVLGIGSVAFGLAVFVLVNLVADCLPSTVTCDPGMRSRFLMVFWLLVLIAAVSAVFALIFHNAPKGPDHHVHLTDAVILVILCIALMSALTLQLPALLSV